MFEESGTFGAATSVVSNSPMRITGIKIFFILYPSWVFLDFYGIKKIVKNSFTKE